MGVDLSLYRLADALQLPFTYDNGTVSGSRKGVLTGPGGIEMDFTITAEKFFSAEQQGLLAHVMGDLHVVVSFFPKSGITSLYLVDASKLTMGGERIAPRNLVMSHNGMRDVFISLGAAITAAFSWRDGKWKPLALPR